MKKMLKISRWLFNHIKPVILPVIASIAMNSFLALLTVYRAVLAKDLIDAAVSRLLSSLIWSIIALLAAVLADTIISSLSSLLTSYFSTKHLNNMQNKLYSHILYSHWYEQSAFHTGDLITRLNNDTATINAFIFHTLPSVISSAVLLSSAFTVLLFYDYKLALTALFIAPVCIIISKVYGDKIRNIHIKDRENESKSISFIQETLQNIIVVKTFCAEKCSIDTLKNLQDNKLVLTLKRSILSLKLNFLLNLSSWAAYSITFFWGAIGLFRGSITFGMLSASFQLVDELISPFYSLARAFPQTISSAASAERLIQLEELGSETMHDHECASPISSSVGIIFDKVCFGYRKDAAILKKVSFSINPGETVALMGSSGEGKTTLVRLILSLINADSGHIFLVNNGQKKEIGPFVRNYISYVPQGNTLFSGTIEENLRFGNPKATYPAMETALKLSCSWDFVNSLENGLNTRIGEKGTGLSEGQAQRLVIARAMLRNMPVLILDEATSALDVDTERKVLLNINRLRPKPTCIIITHRHTALSLCDRVFMLKNGNLKELDLHTCDFNLTSGIG